MYKKYIVKISINILKNEQTGNKDRMIGITAQATQPGHKTNRTNMYNLVNFRKLENPNTYIIKLWGDLMNNFKTLFYS